MLPSRSSSSSSVASYSEPYDHQTKDTIKETGPVSEPPKIKSYIAPGAIHELSSTGPLVDPEVLVQALKLHRMQRSEVAETSDAQSVQTPGPLGLPTSPILPPAPRKVQSTKVSQAWLPAADKGDNPKVKYSISNLNLSTFIQGIKKNHYVIALQQAWPFAKENKNHLEEYFPDLNKN